MDLGNQLKAYRKSKGHSVQKVSELTGINADKIYKWEKGTRPSDAEDLLKIKEYIAGKLENKPSNGGYSYDSFLPEDREMKQAPESISGLTALDRLMKQLESRAEELKADKERLYGIIENYLNSILANSVKNQDDMTILKAQADIAIKQLARQDELIIQKSEALKGGKVKSGKANHND